MLTRGGTADWSFVDGDITPGALTDGRTSAATWHTLRRWLRHAASWGWSAVIAVGLCQIALVLWYADLAMSVDTARMPSWVFLINVALFGSCGAILLFGGRHDLRVRALGALFVLIAASLARAFATLLVEGSTWSETIASVTVDAFFSTAVWRFVWVFPESPKTPRARRIGLGGLGLSLSLGLALTASNLLDYAGAIGPSSGAWGVLRLLDRDSPTSAFWLATLVPAFGALPYLTWKAGAETPRERHRIRLIFLGLAVAMGPFLVAVVASTAFPALGRAPWVHLLGVVLYAALGSAIPTIGAAVLVEKALEVRLALARARQWQLARYAVWLGSLVPLTYLAVDLYGHRHESLAAYLVQGRGVGLFVVLMTGFTALTFRCELLFRVDRWFGAARVAGLASLAELDTNLRASQTLRDAARSLAAALDNAVGPTTTSVFMINEDGALLVPVVGSAPPLPTTSALVDVVRAAGANVRLLLSSDSQWRSLLPAGDQAWLATTPVELMSPVVASTGTLVGVVALGETRHGLAYTDDDHAVVQAMCAQVALRLENRWLREQPTGADGDVPPAVLASAGWRQEPAAICERCSRALPSTMERCGCGGSLKPAGLPLLTAGKFQLERQLGAGGMGVVYLASDLTLGRRVALKTLPKVSQSMVARLQREARAMASVRHPNLALIYAVEEWRGNPVLIVEYLEGGTVLDNLRRGPFSVEETLGLGIVLADVLETLHEAGILHRDVKPSNIGYTLSGEAKLLDLGLAAAFDPLDDAVSPSRRAAVAVVRGDAVASDSRQLGTLRYLAPEALAASAPRPAFDRWALNVVLYEVLAGRHPLAELSDERLLWALRRAELPDIRQFRPDCPAEIATFFAEALALDPRRRPANAADLRAQLQRFLRS